MSEAQPWRPSAKQAIGAIAVLLVAVFAIANLGERARVDFVFDHAEVRVFFTIAGSALLGFAAGALFMHRRAESRARQSDE